MCSNFVLLWIGDLRLFERKFWDYYKIINESVSLTEKQFTYWSPAPSHIGWMYLWFLLLFCFFTLEFSWLALEESWQFTSIVNVYCIHHYESGLIKTRTSIICITVQSLLALSSVIWRSVIVEVGSVLISFWLLFFLFSSL